MFQSTSKPPTTQINVNTVKFKPLEIIDTDRSPAIMVKFQCINVMQEYVNTSSEELRFEYYQKANKKGNHKKFGSTLPMFSKNNDIFGATEISLFGTNQNNPFGNSQDSQFGSNHKNVFVFPHESPFKTIQKFPFDNSLSESFGSNEINSPINPSFVNQTQSNFLNSPNHSTSVFRCSMPQQKNEFGFMKNISNQKNGIMDENDGQTCSRLCTKCTENMKLQVLNSKQYFLDELKREKESTQRREASMLKIINVLDELILKKPENTSEVPRNDLGGLEDKLLEKISLNDDPKSKAIENLTDIQAKANLNLEKCDQTVDEALSDLQHMNEEVCKVLKDLLGGDDAENTKILKKIKDILDTNGRVLIKQITL